MYVGTSLKSPNGLMEASICIAGERQRLYSSHYHGRTYVIGTPGVAYAITVYNLTSGRLEVLCSIDGRNTQRPEAGDLSNHGQVIEARGSWGFDVWRVDNAGGAAFIFGSPADSFAAQAGSPANIGVIGLACYREQDHGHRPTGSSYGEDATLDMLDESPMVAAAMADPTARTMYSTLGTGGGHRIESRVRPVTFHRHGSPDLIVIGYDTEKALSALGVLGPRLPEPFPGATTGYEAYRTIG